MEGHAHRRQQGHAGSWSEHGKVIESHGHGWCKVMLGHGQNMARSLKVKVVEGVKVMDQKVSQRSMVTECHGH